MRDRHSVFASHARYKYRSRREDRKPQRFLRHRHRRDTTARRCLRCLDGFKNERHCGQFNAKEAKLQQDRELQSALRVAHASRVLADPPRVRGLFPRLRNPRRDRNQKKSAFRRDAETSTRDACATQKTSPHFDFNRQQMIDHISSAIGIAQHRLRSAE